MHVPTSWQHVGASTGGLCGPASHDRWHRPVSLPSSGLKHGAQRWSAVQVSCGSELACAPMSGSAFDTHRPSPPYSEWQLASSNLPPVVRNTSGMHKVVPPAHAENRPCSSVGISDLSKQCASGAHAVSDDTSSTGGQPTSYAHVDGSSQPEVGFGSSSHPAAAGSHRPVGELSRGSMHGAQRSPSAHTSWVSVSLLAATSARHT